MNSKAKGENKGAVLRLAEPPLCLFFVLVLQTLDRCGDPAAAVDEVRRRSGIQAHDGTVAEKPAEVESIADFFTDGDTSAHTHSMFVVGDTKQSIYGFQGADPRAFAHNHNEIAKQIEQNLRTIREIPLIQSFRSAPQILYAVDALFNDAETIEKTGFINNTHKYVRSGENSFVELHNLIDGDADEIDTRKYVQMIAQKIQSVLRDTNFTPDDIMVLVQNREPMAPILVRELKQLNIPVAGSDRITLPDFPAIRDLLNLVRFCINNADDYSLCCVLKSPIFRLTERDIFNICKIKNNANNQQKHINLRQVSLILNHLCYSNSPLHDNQQILHRHQY